jgi:uncharacterized protein (TIGR03382 family)
MKALKTLLTVLVLVGASVASAAEDSFFLGEGRNGFRSVTTPGVVVNRYMKITASVSKNVDAIQVDDVTPDGFTIGPGQLVMVLQTATNESVSGEPINLETVASGKLGRWEFARVRAVNAFTLTLALTQPLANSYDAELAQVIYVPEYVSLHISSEGTIQGDPWDNRKGGVVAFLVRDTLINDGKILAGAGFRGAAADSGNSCTGSDAPERGEGLDLRSRSTSGMTRVANAGGGGSCDDAGGGGGGNAGSGGKGGTKISTSLGGEGGASTSDADIDINRYNSILGRLILGGGGGAGHSGNVTGGAGGGAIFIRAGSLIGRGSISANGRDGNASTGGGSSGGGAGGTIILRVVEGLECPRAGALSATGGKGGNSTNSGTTYYGPGGGGGGGRIFVQAPGIDDCAPGVVSGGDAGESTDNSTHGAVPGNPGKFYKLDEAMAAPGAAVIVSPVKDALVNAVRPSVRVDAPDQRKVFIRFDGGPWVGPLRKVDGKYVGEPPVGVNLSEIPHEVQAIAEYKGLWSELHSVTFTVDVTPPNVDFVSKPPERTNLRSARFVFSATKDEAGSPAEVGATFRCTLNGAALPSCAQSVNLDAAAEGLAEGVAHTLVVRAVDVAGNAGPTKTWTWRFDWTPPAKPVVTAPPAFLKSKTYTFSGTAEPKAKVLVSINDDAPVEVDAHATTGAWSFGPYSSLIEGRNRIRAAAKDEAHNVGPLSDTVFFTVDTFLPTVAITHPAEGVTLRDNPLVLRGTAEPGSIVEITIRKDSDGSLVSGPTDVPTGITGDAGGWRYEVSATLTDAKYIIQAIARDDADNRTTLSGRTFTLDRLPPNTTTIACPNRYTSAETVSFSFGSGEGGVTHECAMEGDFATRVLETCPATLDKGSNPDGKYTLMARAKDAVGNVDPSPEVCTWTWDKTPPGPVSIPAGGGPPPVTDSTLAVFHFNASDVHSGPVDYECRLDGDDTIPFVTCSNPYAITVLKGSHTLRVRARDLAGNLSATVTSYPWTVDTGLPVARILPGEGAGNPTNADSATFVFDLKVPLATPVQYYYILNDTTTNDLSKFTPVVGNTVRISLSEVGRYSIRVMARDSERRLDTPRELQDVYSWEVDRTPPKIEIVGRPATWDRFTTANFEFSAPGEKSVAGFRCALSNCVSSAPGTQDCSGADRQPRVAYQIQEGLGEGRNCISVWAQDEAGNLSSEPATYAWNIDTEKPAAPVIEAVQGELKVSTRFPVVEGTTEPDAEVALFVGNASEPVARVGANGLGRWRAQITQELSDGSHNIRASAKDQAGNEGPTSDPVTLLVDSQSPARVIGGGVGCAASGDGSALLAVLGLARLLSQSGRRRRE